MDSAIVRTALQSVLDSPKLIDEAARREYDEDARHCSEDRRHWDVLSEGFKDVFRDGVRQSLRCTLEALEYEGTNRPRERKALPWEQDARPRHLRAA
jgi:hypothetical protein